MSFVINMDCGKNKLDELKTYIKNLGSVAVAFSSGVDSSFLLKVCHDVLLDNAIAITALSPSFSQSEYNESINFCKIYGIKQYFCNIDQLSIPEFTKNTKERCYFCKKNIFSAFLEQAKEHKISYVLEGSNLDDLNDFRPGLKAINELNIKSPLRDCQLTKNEIREYSKQLGLQTWNKPSYACLASRIPFNEIITAKKLDMIEQAEVFLSSLGFVQKRVRFLQNIDFCTAKIEVLAQDFNKVIEFKDKINSKLKEIGFNFICVDLQEFKSGNMNINTKEK